MTPCGTAKADGFHVARIDLVEHVPEGVDVVCARERQGSGHGGDEPRAARDHEGVVLGARAVVEKRTRSLVVNARQTGDAKLGVRVGGDRAQVDLVREAVAERFRDGKRPVDELRLGRDELDGDQLRGKRAQSERGFDAGDAPAGNDDAKGH